MTDQVSKNSRPAGKRHSVSLVSWFSQNTLRGMARRKALLGYIFVAPTILGVTVFVAGPVLFSIALSFYAWNVFQPAKNVGVENYIRMAADSRVLVGFFNSAKFAAIAIGLQIALGLGLALALRTKMTSWMRTYFRTAFFLPFLLSGVATGLVFSYMLNSDFGVVNYYLSLLGFAPIRFLNSSEAALNSVILAYMWQALGFSMIGMLGGLSNVSPDILDAATVDGATGWNWLWHIILPLLSPTIFFMAVVGVISALQIFDQPYAMTRGGPGDASRTMVMSLYEAAFKNMELGYAASISVILFIVIMAVTSVQFISGKKWVFYQ